MNITSFDYPTSPSFKDLSGQQFERLHVDSYYGKDDNYNIYYNCTCKCGNKTIVSASGLKSGDIKSCGCLYKETRFINNKRHGHADHDLYWTHRNMKFRCYNPNSKEYHNYGARGIYVCDEWLNEENGFDNFYNWAMSNSYHKGLSLDRKDNNGPYAPWNCRWADNETQNSNKRNNMFISLVHDFSSIGKGKVIYTYTITQWAKITGISERTIRRRIFDKGWSVKNTLSTPTNRTGAIILSIPEDMLKYNQPDKFDQSVHD